MLDLYAEFRNVTNGRRSPLGDGLLSALTYYGLDGMAVTEKKAMQALAARGGPYTEAEEAALIDYCGADVDALVRLLPRILPDILAASGLPRALLRGRYTRAVAHMEYTGIPVDVATLALLRAHWSTIKAELVARINPTTGSTTAPASARIASWPGSPPGGSCGP